MHVENNEKREIEMGKRKESNGWPRQCVSEGQHYGKYIKGAVALESTSVHHREVG